MSGQGIPHGRILVAAPRRTLSPEQRRYLEKVLRLRPGDSFTVTDGQGREAAAVLGAEGQFEPGPWIDPGRDSGLRIRLHASLIKGDRFEWLLEKGVELGVSAIVPLLARRCVAGPPSEAKLGRWRKLAEEAMLQCGGCRLPEICPPVRPEDLPPPEPGVQAFLLHEERLPGSVTGLPLVPGTVVWLASGPEGGFDPEEVAGFSQAGWQPLWLGSRRLRADTAPLVALSALLLGKPA